MTQVSKDNLSKAIRANFVYELQLVFTILSSQAAVYSDDNSSMLFVLMQSQFFSRPECFSTAASMGDPNHMVCFDVTPDVFKLAFFSADFTI